MRFICALVVFLTHAWYIADLFESETARQRVMVVLPLAMVGVSFFFVISGFVLTWSARPDDSARSFWWRRAVKVYPNHLVLWLGLALFLGTTGSAVVGVLDSRGIPWGPALANLFLLHVWFNDPHYTAGINIVSWSLSAEVFFYLLFPLVFPLVRKIRPERLWLATGLAALAVWTVPVIALQFGGEPVPGIGIGSWQFWISYFCPLGRLPEFVLGMLLARLVRSGRKAPLGMSLSAVLLIISLGAGMALLPFTFMPAASTVVPISLLILAAATADVRATGSWLRRPTMVLLGEISFAFYLVHWPVLHVGTWLLGNRRWETPIALALSVAFFVVSLLFAWLLYSRVEQPLTRRFGMRASWERTDSEPRPAPVPSETVAL